MTQRTEVVFADLVLLSAVFTHTAHPGLVVLERLTCGNAHGKLPFVPRRGKQHTNPFSEMKTTVKHSHSGMNAPFWQRVGVQRAAVLRSVSGEDLQSQVLVELLLLRLQAL